MFMAENEIPSVASSRNAPIDDTGFYSRISPMMTAIREKLGKDQKPKLQIMPPQPTYARALGMAA